MHSVFTYCLFRLIIGCVLRLQARKPRNRLSSVNSSSRTAANSSSGSGLRFMRSGDCRRRGCYCRCNRYCNCFGFCRNDICYCQCDHHGQRQNRNKVFSLDHNPKFLWREHRSLIGRYQKPLQSWAARNVFYNSLFFCCFTCQKTTISAWMSQRCSPE